MNKWLFLLVGLLFCFSVPSYSRPAAQWEKVAEDAARGDPEAIARREFFRDAMRPPFLPSKSPCCGDADAYEADDFDTDDQGNLVAIITCNEPKDCEFGDHTEVDSKGQVYDCESSYGDTLPKRCKTRLNIGTRIPIISERILKPNEPTNRTGHGWVFISVNNQGNINPENVFCYAFPSGL